MSSIYIMTRKPFCEQINITKYFTGSVRKRMAELRKTVTLRRGIGLVICMLIGTGILALPGLALDSGNVHEAILG
jgi:hypothetical protein